MERRPTLLSSCARAATTAEARFRIDVPIAPARAARVVALDEGAAAVLRSVAERPWASARFYACAGSSAGGGEVDLRALDGSPASLGDELDGADVAVMVATVPETSDDASAAATIGAACHARGIMTAGLILGMDYEITPVVSALRRYARVLMIPSDQNDVIDVLTALRA